VLRVLSVRRHVPGTVRIAQPSRQETSP